MGEDPRQPSLSIIIVARNCERLLKECLTRIQSQDYPKSLMEILVVDGGSIDNTTGVAEEFGAYVIKGHYPENAEARRYVGILHARNDIIVFIDSDNLLPHENWLRDMVRPLKEDKEVIGSFTKWYGFTQETPCVDQYFALLGGNDPVVFYLGKNDRAPFQCDRLPRGAILINRTKDYEVVKFNADELPVIGCNGFLIRRDIVIQLQYRDAEEFFHIDANVDIINKLEKNKFAIVKNSVIHLTGDTIKKSIQKRVNYMNLHHVSLAALRRYKVFDSSKRSDVVRLFLTILLSFTFIEPVLRALRGYIRTKNINWMLHPVILFLYVAGYGLSVWNKGFKR